MNYKLHPNGILPQHILKEKLSAGDVGTLVEKHQIEGLERGYRVGASHLCNEHKYLVEK